MQIFYRRKNILCDLNGLSIQQIMDLPKKEKAGSGEFYLKNVFNDNHIQISTKHRRSYERGIHDLKYSAEQKEIKIYSSFPKAAFLLYGYLTMPLIAFFGSTKDVKINIIGIGVLVFIFLSLVLILSIKSDAAAIERELILRINATRRKIR